MKRSNRYVLRLSELSESDRERAGGKALALGKLARAGLPCPSGFCITTKAYDDYLDLTGLRQRLMLLLERKPFNEMRWEELWDLGLRVRSMFLGTPLPDELAMPCIKSLESSFASMSASVRSSAPVEDSASASFAGLHDSFLNIQGTTEIIDHVRLVWASLWSDRALLYRQELHLDPAFSAMAVIVQEFVAGEISGVAFSRSPGQEGLAVIEAVWGLNQGLVDGDVEPDRVLLDRKTGKVVERHEAVRENACRPRTGGVTIVPLSLEEREKTPLPDSVAKKVLSMLVQAEGLFGAPQDLEWTIRGDAIHALQARPITTSTSPDQGGERAWYLSLHRSLSSLKELRQVIEAELLPEMTGDASRAEALDLLALDDGALAKSIRERQHLLDHWEGRYREACIPMAHGIRLFGQVYNDRLRPEDPFAFLEMLAGDEGIVAVNRNDALLELAAMLRDEPHLAAKVREGTEPRPGSRFAHSLANFHERFGDFSWVMGEKKDGLGGMMGLLLEMAVSPSDRAHSRQSPDDASFLDSFSADEQTFARELLEIARVSYRLRDNDNMALGKLKKVLFDACEEASQRLEKRESSELAHAVSAIQERVSTSQKPTVGKNKRNPPSGVREQARQLVGQPAGPGLARGTARVITQASELASFRSGEILVCDAVDPNMTFIVPLASGIVERRGGMLIHGAIIAREYGLSCVTGVPGATDLIRTGDSLTVDGFLGIVTVSKGSGQRKRRQRTGKSHQPG